MRRFSKIFSGIAAILLGVGILLVAAGIGRARSDWEKYRESGQGSDQVEQEFDGVGSIRIDVPFGYMYIGTSEDGKVHFQAKNVTEENLFLLRTGEELDIRMDGGKSTVTSLSFMAMGWGVDREGFVVQEYRLLLPEDYSGRMNIGIDCGKLFMEGVRAGEMDISMNAGELILSDCHAERLDAGCDIGNCMVEGSFKDIRVNGNMGVLNVNVYGGKEDYDGVIRCDIGELAYYSYDSGNVQFPGYAVGRHDQWNQSGGLGIHERWEGRNAKGKLEVKCDIGSVNVTFSGSVQDAIAGTSDEPQIPDVPPSGGSVQDVIAEPSDEPDISGWETQENKTGTGAE